MGFRVSRDVAWSTEKVESDVKNKKHGIPLQKRMTSLLTLQRVAVVREGVVMRIGVSALILLAPFFFNGASAEAQEAAAFFGGENIRSPSLSFESQAQSAPANDAGLWFEEEKLGFITPVFSDGETNFSALVRAQRTRFGRDLVFADKGLNAPSDFGLAELGVNWSDKDSEGNRLGAVALYGSSGPRLFAAGSAPLWSANAFIERKAEAGGKWLYFVNISNTRSRWNNIPIPGFAYVWSSASANLVVGLPFIFAMWRPDPWMLSLNVSPFAVSTEGAYRVWGPVQIFSGLGWQPRAYLNLIPDSSERLIFDRKEATAGARLFMGPKGSFSLAYVHGFGRRIFLGNSISDAHSEVQTLDDSGGLQARGRYSF
jgi:hypothetical protein